MAAPAASRSRRPASATRTSWPVRAVDWIAIMRRAILLPPVFLLPLAAQCQQLPIRSYTVADGLAEGRVNGIMADSRGYVWIAASGGLSRFDGYRMKTYG